MLDNRFFSPQKIKENLIFSIINMENPKDDSVQSTRETHDQVVVLWRQLLAIHPDFRDQSESIRPLIERRYPLGYRRELRKRLGTSPNIQQYLEGMEDILKEESLLRSPLIDPVKQDQEEDAPPEDAADKTYHSEHESDQESDGDEDHHSGTEVDEITRNTEENSQEESFTEEYDEYVEPDSSTELNSISAALAGIIEDQVRRRTSGNQPTRPRQGNKGSKTRGGTMDGAYGQDTDYSTGSTESRGTYTRNQPACYHCDQNHTIYTCQEFRSLKRDERINRAEELGLCLCCMKRGHQKLNCPSLGRCKEDNPDGSPCNKKHNTLLH